MDAATREEAGQRGRTPVSVCLATFNGLTYLPEQLESILVQLGPSDEVVVVDDASTDGTVEWLRTHPDPRVQVEVNPRNCGHVATFMKALSLVHGEVVFLSDQDDVWLPGRVDAMQAALAHAHVVATNFVEFGDVKGAKLPPLQAWDSGRGVVNVLGIFLGRRAYFGCAMAVRGDFLAAVLPVPGFMAAHDLWIALMGNVAGRVVHLEEPTIRRRLHGGNLTPQRRRGWPAVLATRVGFVRAVLIALARRSRVRRISAP